MHTWLRAPLCLITVHEKILSRVLLFLWSEDCCVGLEFCTRMGKATQSTTRAGVLLQHVHAQTALEDLRMIQQLHDIVALSTLITKWADYMVIGNECTASHVLKKLMFTRLWCITCWWPPPIITMMVHPAAL
jgi:hypothetical protein